MVLGYHVIFGMYGFWLPNDPRGSWSQFVGSWELARLGRATTVTTRRSLAGRQHDRTRRQAGVKAMKFPPTVLNGQQARAVGRGFATYSNQASLAIWACAIMPQHVHLVVAPGTAPVEKAVIQLKGAATRQLDAEQLNPTNGRHKVFARSCWRVYLHTPADVRRSIDYVRRNPVRDGLPEQRWRFVKPYDAQAPSDA